MQVLFVFPGKGFNMFDKFLENDEIRIGYKLNKELFNLSENKRLDYIKKVALRANPKISEHALKGIITRWNSFFDLNLKYCIFPTKGWNSFCLVKLKSNVQYDPSSNLSQVRKFELISELTNYDHHQSKVGISKVSSEKITGLDEMINDYEAGHLKRSKIKVSPNDPELECYEGEQKKSLEKHLKRERNSDFRIKYRILNRHILNCSACGIRIKNIFGLNDDHSFLELHLIEPLKYRKESITTSKCVTSLCPNCHRAIHNMMIENEVATINIEAFRKKILPSLFRFFE